MTRTKSGFISRNKSKKVLQLTKGFIGSHSKLFTVANQQNMKALRSSYCDRRKKKSDYKNLWVTRMNATARMNGKNYSFERYKSKQLKITINRKMISEDNLRVSWVFKHIHFNSLFIYWVRVSNGRGLTQMEQFGKATLDAVMLYVYFNEVMAHVTFDKYKFRIEDYFRFELRMIQFVEDNPRRSRYQNNEEEVYNLVTLSVDNFLADQNLQDCEVKFVKDKCSDFFCAIFDPFMTQKTKGFITGRKRIWIDRFRQLYLIDDMIHKIIMDLYRSEATYTPELKELLRTQVRYGFSVKQNCQYLTRWESSILTDACLLAAETIVGVPGTPRTVCDILTRSSGRKVLEHFPTTRVAKKTIDTILLKVLAESVAQHCLNEYKRDYICSDNLIMLRKNKYITSSCNIIRKGSLYTEFVVSKFKDFRRSRDLMSRRFVIGTSSCS
jgi:large subunit ribosomal protein L20